MSNHLRRSSRLSTGSTSSNPEEPWYLLCLPNVGIAGSYGYYRQSQIKIQMSPESKDLEVVRVNNIEGMHEFEILKKGNKHFFLTMTISVAVWDIIMLFI